MDRAMPEAHVLYVTAAVVITGLVGWTAVVLAKAKEPWGRPPPPAPALPLQPALAPGGDPDATAQATPVTMGDASKATEEPRRD
jgi:hypothetical protein